MSLSFALCSECRATQRLHARVFRRKITLATTECNDLSPFYFRRHCANVRVFQGVALRFRMCPRWGRDGGCPFAFDLQSTIYDPRSTIFTSLATARACAALSPHWAFVVVPLGAGSATRGAPEGATTNLRSATARACAVLSPRWGLRFVRKFAARLRPMATRGRARRVDRRRGSC